LCDQQIVIFIYDDQKNRLVHYQSHSEFTLESLNKCANNSNNVSIEKYDNDNYDIMENERIIKEKSDNQIQFVELEKTREKIAIF
jgi:hypothetical protein